MTLTKEQEKIMATLYDELENEGWLVDIQAIHENAYGAMQEHLQEWHEDIAGTPEGKEMVAYFADMVLANIPPPPKQARPVKIHGSQSVLDKTRFLGE